MAATYTAIATSTIASPTLGITFSSIPSTYSDLRLVVVANDGSGNSLALRFNSDTGTNYSTSRLLGNGSTASSDSVAGFTYIISGNIASSAGLYSLTAIDIFNYTDSTYKTVLTANSADYNGSGLVRRNAGLWRSTSVINSLTIVSNDFASNFAIGTTATLYGIKAA